MILITGVTGPTGRAAAEFLLGRGVRFQGLVGDPARAADLSARDMEFIQGNMLVAADIAKAAKGVASALLVTPNGRRQLEMERNFGQAAAESGVRYLVKISTIRVPSRWQAIGNSKDCGAFGTIVITHSIRADAPSTFLIFFRSTYHLKPGVDGT